MITPLRARPCPCSSGVFLNLESARWPQTTPATAIMRKKPQQNPHRPSTLKRSDKMASGSVLGGAGTEAIGITGPLAGAVTAGVLTLAAAAGAAETGAAAAPALAPGTVESAAQPAAPSYHARSERLSVPAANCRLTSSSGKGPIFCPLRAIWICMRQVCRSRASSVKPKWNIDLQSVRPAEFYSAAKQRSRKHVRWAHRQNA